MELLSCNCKRKCISGECPCIDNDLLCTNACNLKNCENMPVESDNDTDEFDEDEDESDIGDDDEDSDDMY